MLPALPRVGDPLAQLSIPLKWIIMPVLTQDEVEALRRVLTKTLDILVLSGMNRRKARQRLQTYIYDIFERRSAACPYEQLRARSFLVNHPTLSGDLWFHVTGGNSNLRVPLNQIRKVRPGQTLRKVRRALSALNRKGLKVEAVYVFELVVVRYLDGREELEPHFHVLIRGATADQLKAAFAFRKVAKVEGRRRALHVEPVHHLPGLLGYLTKFKAQSRVEYLKVIDGEAKKRWRANDLRGSALAEWTRFMSRYEIADLLKFHSIDGRDLRLAGRAELSSPRPRGPQGRGLRASGKG